jgi:hypothetical protein
MAESFTLIDAGGVVELPVDLANGSVRVAPGELASVLGWELKPQGFCKDDLCYPVAPGSAVVSAAGVDLGAFAALIDRPMALDIDERAAFLGASARVRAGQLASLLAPDFSLPDLAGRVHTLSDYKGRKVLLAAYGSW